MLWFLVNASRLAAARPAPFSCSGDTNTDDSLVGAFKALVLFSEYDGDINAADDIVKGLELPVEADVIMMLARS